MRYLRLASSWGPAGDRASWGHPIDYFEIGPDGYAVRQINAHVSGPTLEYDANHAADDFGSLADQCFPEGPYPLEEGDGEATDLDADEFEALWARSEAINGR